jgi:hypothetical protein
VHDFLQPLERNGRNKILVCANHVAVIDQAIDDGLFAASIGGLKSIIHKLVNMRSKRCMANSASRGTLLQVEIQPRFPRSYKRQSFRSGRSPELLSCTASLTETW